jgi:DMSO/TMAO reductase YedYZ molybdopterin-dependent catalytic subunit
MTDGLSRRETLKRTLAAAGALALVPEWALPALAQGEIDVPFTDIPATFNPSPADGARRFLDLRTIDGLITPTDRFFFIQHYDKPTLDAATYRLKVTGLVNKPTELSLADLQSMRSVEVVNGYECSGNSARAMQGLSSNGRFTGVRLRDVLQRAGVGDKAREVVFFGADKGNEDVVFRQQTLKVQQQFARSITLENAMKPEPLLAWALNGQPLGRDHGFPIRVVMPGWYGVANVKWLNHIHVQDSRFMGRFMARDYVTLQGQSVGDTTVWNETSVGRIRLKSAIGRVTRAGATLKATGFALTDGTPIKAIDISVNGGPWKPALLDKRNTRFSWQLFTYEWPAGQPGEQTIVSRATDVNGAVQPTEDDLRNKKTRWENNGQFVRKFRVG